MLPKICSPASTLQEKKIVYHGLKSRKHTHTHARAHARTHTHARAHTHSYVCTQQLRQEKSSEHSSTKTMLRPTRPVSTRSSRIVTGTGTLCSQPLPRLKESTTSSMTSLKMEKSVLGASGCTCGWLEYRPTRVVVAFLTGCVDILCLNITHA